MAKRAISVASQGFFLNLDGASNGLDRENPMVDFENTGSGFRENAYADLVGIAVEQVKEHADLP